MFWLKIIWQVDCQIFLIFKIEINSFVIDCWFVDIIFVVVECVYVIMDVIQYVLFSECDRSQEFGERFV